MMKAILFSFTLLLCVPGHVFSQEADMPQVGKPFPQVTFHNVSGSKKTDFSVADQKGKWLIINFWSLGCTSCFKVFKTIKEIKTIHGDKVQVLQVGKKDNDFNANVELIYQRISANMKLKVPATYDTILRKMWDFYAYPTIYIIDADGILRFITDGRDLSADKVTSLLNKQPVYFFPMPTGEFPDFDVCNFSENKNVRTVTLISECTGEAPYENVELYKIGNLPADVKSKGWRCSRITLAGLYNYAYFGKEMWPRWDTSWYAKVYPYPILEMSDTSMFRVNTNVSPPTGTFNCFIKNADPGASSDQYMHQLREGLKNTFRYSVFVEQREMPVWSLVATPAAVKNLKTKGGNTYRTPGSAAGGFVVRNQPMDELLALLTSHLSLDRRTMFVDETGINTSVDFDIKGDLTDFKFIRHELSKHGLEFVRKKKLMSVLVIRD